MQRCHLITVTFSEKEAASVVVEFSASEFVKMNKGLIRLLKYVAAESGTAVVATRKACQDIFNSRTYGMKVIKRAERLGYIRRVKEPPVRQGNWMMVNYLTDRGRELLSRLDNNNNNNNNNNLE